MSSCSFGQFRLRLNCKCITRWSVKVRSCCVSCRRLEVPYLKELQLSFPPWQVRRGLSIHLGSTNIDPDSLVSLACYLANQGSSCNDLSCVGSAFRTIAMSMSRPGIALTAFQFNGTRACVNDQHALGSNELHFIVMFRASRNNIFCKRADSWWGRIAL